MNFSIPRLLRACAGDECEFFTKFRIKCFLFIFLVRNWIVDLHMSTLLILYIYIVEWIFFVCPLFRTAWKSIHQFSLYVFYLKNMYKFSQCFYYIYFYCLSKFTSHQLLFLWCTKMMLHNFNVCKFFCLNKDIYNEKSPFI